MPDRAPDAARPPVPTGRAALAASLGLLAGACSFGYDAGSTPEEQLCDILEPTLELAAVPGDFRLEPVLEGAATDPTEVPGELLTIGFAYRSHESAYDQLGSFRPAMAFAAHLAEMASDDLLGPTTLTPTVLDSALAIDEALAGGACTS